MHSIKTKITAMTVCVIVIAMAIATVFGVTAIRDIGNHDAQQTLLLLCETGQKDLNYYFQNVEQSVETVAAFAETDLDGVDDEHLQAHMDRVSDVFQKLAYKTNGVLTYYYRIDPEVSKKVKGFWYVNTDNSGFRQHEVTDITDYDTKDTSALVWFTVPKATGKGVWLPPYITDNLGARVISYNVPVYHKEKFIGVIGIEIDYSTMAEVVNHITLYDNGYAFLNDEEGNIIYHPKMDVTTMETLPQVPSGLLGNDKFIRYSFDGIETITVEKKLTTRWSDLIDANISNELIYLRGFMEHAGWYELTPDFDYGNAFKKSASKEGYYACAHNGDEVYVVYLYNRTKDSAGSLVNMDANATYTAQWFDTRTGTYTLISDSIKTNGEYDIPQKPVADDMVLLVTKN